MARANVPHVISDDSALGGQLISGSLKFDRVSSSVGTYLKRTPSTNGNRKKFALSLEKNSVHGSDSPENAEIEINHFFDEADIIS